MKPICASARIARRLRSDGVGTQLALFVCGFQACSTREVDESGYHEKKLKVVKKEGGKKGAELAGAADMGGIEFALAGVAYFRESSVVRSVFQHVLRRSYFRVFLVTRSAVDCVLVSTIPFNP